MKITEVNVLKKEEFLLKFRNIVEGYPEIANELYCTIPFLDVHQIIELSGKILEELPLEEKAKILNLHPDLAGKLADEGKLTAESGQEQQAAALHNLTNEKKSELIELNKEYKKKFGFPFVICVRENKVDAILKGLRSRLNNYKEEELTNGINEVKKICKLRIEDIISN